MNNIKCGFKINLSAILSPIEQRSLVDGRREPEAPHRLGRLRGPDPGPAGDHDRARLQVLFRAGEIVPGLELVVVEFTERSADLVH